MHSLFLLSLWTNDSSLLLIFNLFLILLSIIEKLFDVIQHFLTFQKEGKKLVFLKIYFSLMMEIGIEAEWVAIFLFDIAEWVKGVKIEYILDKATLNLFLWKLQMLIMQVKRRSRCEFVTYTALSSWWPISLLGFFEIMGKGLYLSYIVRKISFFICPYISILHPLHHN